MPWRVLALHEDAGLGTVSSSRLKKQNKGFVAQDGKGQLSHTWFCFLDVTLWHLLLSY